MALVDYSDSEGDGEGGSSISTSTSAPTGKSTFQKVVDRSNPGKIKVSLPQASSLKDDIKTDEPPTKRVKTGGGASGGFNSFLPAPKRTGQSTLGGGNATRKNGLGVGISLKTGATPAFSREPEPEREHKGESARDEEMTSGSGMNLPPPNSLVDQQKPADEVKLVGKPLMFKPLSVARKSTQKKTRLESITSTPSTSTPKFNEPATPQNLGKSTPKPKVSLFSLEVEPVNSSPYTPSNGEYKPMLYQPSSYQDQDQEPTYEDYTPTTTHTLPFAPTPPVNPHNTESLSSIADTLHLSAAERRQLFGRQKGGGSQATKIINFNTDQEYAHNEELRAAGEQVVHNPVRSIAPGKHSLKQLVGAAQSQKEALEESFATGRNNRKEAGSKYGW
ncbi:hypothetical protein DSL72_003687 [Monilinia vaccinii-corymbosi]|uniref:Mitotic checkpoint regulator, MAD2B-interacting-domain-containing protein n=1 Tax=Monilinia vaccinii-corymbosi TaxID=61207 RepID=A0A8A3P1Y9_9HELO|nr:hypothetical protein DSL72_003687 [Monilinia vaccinii-corymbosi]